MKDLLSKIANEMGFEYDQDDDFGGLPVLPPEERREPEARSANCYICRDPSYAAHGLPLCRKCPACGGHVAADDTRCDSCGLCDQSFWQLHQLVKDGEMVYEEAWKTIASCFLTADWKQQTAPATGAVGAARIAFHRSFSNESVDSNG